MAELFFSFTFTWDLVVNEKKFRSAHGRWNEYDFPFPYRFLSWQSIMGNDQRSWMESRKSRFVSSMKKKISEGERLGKEKEIYLCKSKTISLCLVTLRDLFLPGQVGSRIRLFLFPHQTNHNRKRKRKMNARASAETWPGGKIRKWK